MKINDEIIVVRKILRLISGFIKTLLFTFVNNIKAHKIMKNIYLKPLSTFVSIKLNQNK